MRLRAVPVRQSRVARRPTAKRTAEGNAACLTRAPATVESQQLLAYFPSAKLTEVGSAAGTQDARSQQPEGPNYVGHMGVKKTTEVGLTLLAARSHYVISRHAVTPAFAERTGDRGERGAARLSSATSWHEAAFLSVPCMRMRLTAEGRRQQG